MLYSSLAFGIGPIVAPFFGGLLQYHFGWKANFIAYGVVSFLLMTIFMLLVDESQKSAVKFSIKNIIGHYKTILEQNAFISGFLISGISEFQLLVYTTTGAFIIENVFHRTAIAYGNSALLVSCRYLLGTLTNRIMLKHFSTNKLVQFGFALLFFAIMLELFFSIYNIFNLITLILPIALIGFANGFIFYQYIFSLSSPYQGGGGNCNRTFYICRSIDWCDRNRNYQPYSSSFVNTSFWNIFCFIYVTNYNFYSIFEKKLVHI